MGIFIGDRDGCLGRGVAGMQAGGGIEGLGVSDPFVELVIIGFEAVAFASEVRYEGLGIAYLLFEFGAAGAVAVALGC